MSGSASLIADSGQNCYFEFSNIPRDTDFETQMKAEYGLDCIAFRLNGTAVAGHYSTVNVQDPEFGSITRYFAKDNSEIFVVLFADTVEKLQEILD
jgi:hypothetical protein